MTFKELEKYVDKWVSFKQLNEYGTETGVVRCGKLFKTQIDPWTLYICCFKSDDNPDARDGYIWRGRPDEYNRSWLMRGTRSKGLFYKDLKMANTIGDFGNG